MEILAYLAYETVAQVRILICHISPYMAAFSLTLSMTPPAAPPGMRTPRSSAMTIFPFLEI